MDFYAPTLNLSLNGIKAHEKERTELLELGAFYTDVSFFDILT